MKRKKNTPSAFRLRDMGILVQAWVLLLAVELGLRTAPVRRVQQVLTVGLGWRASRRGGDPYDVIERLQRVVGVAAHHHVVPMHCLQRSLVLQTMLARRGIKTDLRLGVRKEQSKLDAHAWLEYEGRSIQRLPAPQAGYLPLESADRDH